MKKIIFLILTFSLFFIFDVKVEAKEAVCIYKYGARDEYIEVRFDQKTGENFSVIPYDGDDFECYSCAYTSQIIIDKFEVSEPDENVKYECLPRIFKEEAYGGPQFYTQGKGGNDEQEVKLDTSSLYDKSKVTQESGEELSCSYEVTSAGATKGATFVVMFTSNFKSFNYMMKNSGANSYDLRPDKDTFEKQFKAAYEKNYKTKKDHKLSCPKVYTVYYQQNNRYSASLKKEDLQDGTITTEDNIEETKANENKYFDEDFDELYDPNWSPEHGCALLQKGTTIDVLRKILNYLDLAAVALLLILGSVDFAGAIMSDKEDAMKQAGDKFKKRLIACVIVFLVPALVNLVLFVANKSESICDLLSGGDSTEIKGDTSDVDDTSTQTAKETAPTSGPDVK